MQDVFVKTDGIAYLRECLTRYTGSTGYLLLYFAALIFIMLKGSEKEKKIFVPMSILTIITVYNPIFPHVLSLFTKINSEYYRFFWMTPVVILVPYVLTKLILAIISGEIKNRVAVIIITALILILSSSSILKSGIRFAENIYKIPDELIEISEIIHNDSKDEYSRAFLEYEYNMQMRQYDPRMLLTIDREDYLTAVSQPYNTEQIDSDEFPQYRILAALIRYQKVDTGKLLEAFDMTGTEYIVLTTGSTMIPVLKNAGLSEIAVTKNHTVLKYELKDKTPFELVDYSECYRNGW